MCPVRRLAELRDAVAAARGDDAIHAALTAFADLLEAHVRREERELFAFFPEAIGEVETRRIGDAIRAVLATRDPARCNIQDQDGRLLVVESASAPLRLRALVEG